MRRATSCRRPEDRRGRGWPRGADSCAAVSLRSAQLAHREVLDDAVLHVVEAGVVGVEDPARLGDVEPVVGTGAPRQLEHRVEPGADPAVLGALLAGALEPVDLLGHGRPRTSSGARSPPARSAAVLRRRCLVVVTFAELLADRRELLTQQELALLPLHPPPTSGGSSPSPPARASVPNAHWRRPTRVFDVDRLEELDLLLGRQVAPRAEAVGERAGLGCRAEQLGQTTGAATLSEHREHAPVLPDPAPRRRRRRRRSRPGPRPTAPPRYRPRRCRGRGSANGG